MIKEMSFKIEETTECQNKWGEKTYNEVVSENFPLREKQGQLHTL